jgi:tetratricopeptide (TPR) repeat protein
MNFTKLGVSCILILGFAALVIAHEGIHEQIEEVTKQIVLNPKDANLFLRRGELYRWHGNLKRALADYATAEKLDPHLDAVQFCRGRLYFDQHQYAVAQKHFDQFLIKHPDHVEGHVTRARLFVAMKRYREAAQDYTEAIRHAPDPPPEYYIEKSNAISAEGEAHTQEAIDALNEGIQRLGPIVTLQLPAIDLDLKVHQYDSALQRIDTLMAQSERKESWLYQRGKILKQAGRDAEARDAFQNALSALESLPPHLRETRATQELESQIRNALNQNF